MYHAPMKNQMTWAEEINHKADTALAQRGLTGRPAGHSMMVQYIEDLRRAALAPHKPREGGLKIAAHRVLCNLLGVPVTIGLEAWAAEFQPHILDPDYEWIVSEK